jgi:predicted nucleotidyltransferase
MVTGSVAYGLANSSSDVDYLGVYIAKPSDLLAIESPVPVAPLSTMPEDVGKEADITMYELGQFLRQILKGTFFLINNIRVITHCYYKTVVW